MRAEMDADIGVRVSTYLTDARTGTRCRWYTRLAAECTCPPAQAPCPPLGTADDHVAADWLDGDGASTFAEGARLRRYSRSNRGRCARRAWPVLTVRSPEMVDVVGSRGRARTRLLVGGTAILGGSVLVVVGAMIWRKRRLLT